MKSLVTVVLFISAAALNAGSAMTLLNKAKAVQSNAETAEDYAACIIATENLTASWCPLVRGFAQNWDVCTVPFEFLDSYGACSISVVECAELTTDPRLRPVAAECLKSCSEESGCSLSSLGKLLNTSGVCSEFPPGYLSTILSPWAPVAGLLNAAVNMILTAPYNFAVTEKLSDRFPIADYVGAWIQCLVLFRCIYLTIEHTIKTSSSTCGFLLFSSWALSAGVSVPLAQVAAVYGHISHGLETYPAESYNDIDWARPHSGQYRGGLAGAVALGNAQHDYDAIHGTASPFMGVTSHKYDNKALTGAKFASKPLIFTAICMAIMWACTIPLLLSGIPGMIALCWVTFPLLLLYGYFYFRMVDFAERWHTKWEGQKHESTMGERSVASFVLKMTFVFYGCQLLAGFSIISWVVYSGTNYGTIAGLVMDFKLPLFNWNFDLSFYFSQSIWQRIFSFELNDFELFGTSVMVQLLTYGLAVLRKIASLVSCAQSGAAKVQEMIPLYSQYKEMQDGEAAYHGREARYCWRIKSKRWRFFWYLVLCYIVVLVLAKIFCDGCLDANQTLAPSPSPPSNTTHVHSPATRFA
jgi:hypothetical protein